MVSDFFICWNSWIYWSPFRYISSVSSPNSGALWWDKAKIRLWLQFSPLLAYFSYFEQEVLDRTNPWCDTDHIENDASNNSSVVACVFVTAATFPPSRCLATIEGFLSCRCLATVGGILTSRLLAKIMGLLPSRCLATIRGYTDTHGQQRDLIILFIFQNRNVG
jgi:hypothetical protein